MSKFGVTPTEVLALVVFGVAGVKRGNVGDVAVLSCLMALCQRSKVIAEWFLRFFKETPIQDDIFYDAVSENVDGWIAPLEAAVPIVEEWFDTAVDKPKKSIIGGFLKKMKPRSMKKGRVSKLAMKIHPLRRSRSKPPSKAHLVSSSKPLSAKEHKKINSSCTYTPVSSFWPVCLCGDIKSRSCLFM